MILAMTRSSLGDAWLDGCDWEDRDEEWMVHRDTDRDTVRAAAGGGVVLDRPMDG